VRAAVCPTYGPPEVVRIEERDVPGLEPGQVLVRVEAAAVNFPDVLLVANQYQISVPTPFVPGSEFAGVIDEVASEATGFAVGDRVTGTGLFGAFAERVAMPAAGLSRIPDGIDAPTAAAFGVAHRTAYHTLRSVARVGAGDQLVVLGAGGGVGLAAVQLGVALGAKVTAVASSTEKLEVAARYGATTLVNHRDGELRAALRNALPEGADAVVDPVGGELSEPALRSLRRGGRFVTVGYASGVIPRIPLNLVLVKGVQVLGFQFQDVPAAEFGRNEDELGALLTTGAVTPHIGASYPLADTARALRKVADGQAVGKVLIDFRGREEQIDFRGREEQSGLSSRG
jgi:NADPH:quinone reductase